MEEIRITNHAYDRLKERTGYSPSKAREVAEKAYYCGKDISDFKKEKEIQKYLKNVLTASHEQNHGDKIRVMGNDIYLFGGVVLITVFPFPPRVAALKGKYKCNKRRFYNSEFEE